MKRIRTIKPEFFTSEDITSIKNRDIRLTFIGLWLYVDDYGNENAKESLVKAAIWPEDDDITLDVVAEHLLYLAEHDQIRFYKSGTRQYLRITNWAKHQRVDKPSKTNVPGPDETLATTRPEGVAKEGKGESGGEGSREGERGGEPGGDDEGERAGAGEREPGTSRASSLPPSPFCKNHPEGTLTPCRPCGNARLARRQWDEQIAAEFQSPMTHPVAFKSGEPDDDDLPY